MRVKAQKTRALVSLNSNFLTEPFPVVFMDFNILVKGADPLCRNPWVSPEMILLLIVQDPLTCH